MTKEREGVVGWVGETNIISRRVSVREKKYEIGHELGNMIDKKVKRKMYEIRKQRLM